MLVEPLADVDRNVPGVIATLAAPITDQLRLLLVPEFMLGGFASNDAICGTVPFPVGAGELAELPAAAQPASPAQQSRASAVAKTVAKTRAQSSSREDLSPPELRFFPQIELDEFTRNPFVAAHHTSLVIAGLVCLLVVSTELDA